MSAIHNFFIIRKTYALFFYLEIKNKINGIDIKRLLISKNGSRHEKQFGC